MGVATELSLGGRDGKLSRPAEPMEWERPRWR